MAKVTVDGWEPGFEKIKFTHLLMDRTHMGLADAKHATDDLLAGKSIHLEFDSNVSAEGFVATAHLLGARVSGEETV